MPTKQEIKEYVESLKKMMTAIQNSDLSERDKAKMTDYYLKKFSDVRKIYLGEIYEDEED